MIKTELIERCSDYVKTTGPKLHGAYPICHDTRYYQNPSIFFAFPGSRNNPLTLIAPLLGEGCPVVIYEMDADNDSLAEDYSKKFPRTSFVAVEEMVNFTQELSQHHIEGWRTLGQGRQVFAISGSNGKTTHKEMLGFLLKAALGEKVVVTEKNNNNHLGVPLTLLRVAPETRLCVLELGSNHPGEIKVLCDIARPTAGLVTNIGATHLEFFGTEEKVFDEEGYLYHAIRENSKDQGLYLQNVDDRFLSRFPHFDGTLTFSSQKSADLRFHPHGNEVQIEGKLGTVTLKNPALTGAHNLCNMATSWAIASILFPESKEIFTKAAGLFVPTPNRSEWKDWKKLKVYLDAYNANPSSMKVAISGFFEWLSNHQVTEENAGIVLGDMNELGEKTPEYHREIGEFLNQWPQAQVVFVGRFAQHYAQGRSNSQCFESAASFKASAWSQMTQSKSYWFIKGSRSLQLESLLDIT